MAILAGLFAWLQTAEKTAAPQAAERPAPARPYSFCFAPGTAPELMAKYSTPTQTLEPAGTSLLSAQAQQAFQIADRWFRTATNGTSQSSQGDPLTLTWSIADDGGTFITADGNIEEEVSSNSDLRARLAQIYGGSATAPAENQPWFPLFEQVFENLSSQTGLTFVYEPNDDGANLNGANPGQLGVRGDIRIAGHPLDGNSNVLAYNFLPDIGDMVIDTDDSFFTNLSNNSRRLRNVVEHEIGHGLGLAHVCPGDNTKIMEPFINTGFDGSQFDDIYSLQRNYGDPLESHDSTLSNDSFSNAAPLTIPADGSLSIPLLSIDDNSDIDFYAIELLAGQTITARASPSNNSYLEGPQNNDGSCSAGTLFDSSNLHNLTLILFDPNQNQVAAATGQPIGQAETIDSFEAITPGTYYLQVNGGSANNAQLYSLSINLVSPGVFFDLVSVTQTNELFVGQNGDPDPMEPVEYTFTLRNNGELESVNTNAALTGPASFIPLEDTASLGTIAPDQSATFPLTFALNEVCGESISLQLDITEDGSSTVSFPVELSLGTNQIVLNENFDDATPLPAGWQSSSTDAGSGWSVNALSDTAPNAFVAFNPAQAGQSFFTTSNLGPITTDSVFSFRHFYDTEDNFDGGVLEISIANGAWLDIITAGGSFQTGGYVGPLNTFNGSNPIEGRDAWHGDSGGYITTEILLPASAAEQIVRFRWRMGHDSLAGGLGWLVDTILLQSQVCDAAEAALTLSSNDTVASEFVLSDDAVLTVTTPLPVLSDYPVTLSLSGSATPQEDYSSLSGLQLLENTNTLTTTIDALEDNFAEGPETLIVSSPDGSSSISFTINDSPFGAWAFANSLGGSPLQNPNDNPDGDSLSNLEEYLFGTNPLHSNPPPAFDTVFSENALRLTFPNFPPPADILISPFSSPDLLDWDADLFIRQEGDQYILEAPTSPYFMQLEYSLRGSDAP